jgi:hypothetical protein
MANFDEIKGSCFCAANQFAITQPAVEMHHCHCSVCRRLQGAAFVTLSIFPKAGFRWTRAVICKPSTVPKKSIATDAGIAAHR